MIEATIGSPPTAGSGVHAVITRIVHYGHHLEGGWSAWSPQWPRWRAAADTREELETLVEEAWRLRDAGFFGEGPMREGEPS